MKKVKAYQGEIIKRMMDEKQFEEFSEDYNNHRFHQRESVITELDQKLALDWKKGMLTRELSQKYKMTQSKVDSRIRVVARNFYRNS